MQDDTGDCVRWFETIGIHDRPSVGGKGASLGEMRSAGFKVPPGFVITTAAFERFLSGVDLDGLVRRRIEKLDPADLEMVMAVTEDVRALVMRAPVPAALEADIVTAWKRLGDTSAVAVRSSATTEDAEDASFAGLQDTYLWVRGEASLLDSVRRCWASLYSVESVVYRRKRRYPESSVAMAVVVQRMVNSRTSGVMFTRSPQSGDRSVVAIECSWGLGSAIVAGEVTPDAFTVSKATNEILKRRISDKTMMNVPHDSGGVCDQAVPDDKRTVPCVSTDELRALALLGRTIEAHYGRPQDIEWAIEEGADGTSEIFLLQSRPETVWSNRETAPIATVKRNPLEHLLGTLGGRH
ncbi:MAG: PEP/pyruvate-binding domain-containing protein [Xanthobacteraceae bacterium]